VKHDLFLGDAILRIDDSDGAAVLIACGSRERLVAFPHLAMLVPSATTHKGCFHVVDARENEVECSVQSDLFRAQVIFRSTPAFLTVETRLDVLEDFELNRLSIFPNGTELNLYDVVNYRHRHYTPILWPEQLLGGKGCATDTFSGDWQFAPHPSMMMFRKEDLTLCVGAVDLPTSFGMYLRATDYRIDEMYLNYGEAGFGLTLYKGDRWAPPRFCMFLDRGRSPIETTRRYTDLLVETGRIPDPVQKIRYGWHRSPLYCTWMDQGFVAEDTPADELGEQQLTGSNPTVEACSEEFVHQILACMDAESLKFRTFLLDDGWQVTRGQWDAHPERFPNLRGLVDELHELGMKVIVWWNWAEVFDDAEIDESELAGQGWRNKHGRRVRDYSDPKTQESYLKPLFHKFFSSDPGCYDFDGFKSDFLADKVHPDMPLKDPAWRGEENYCYRLFELCYKEMKAHKPDACHVGCAGHPYLAEFIDINRTYDVATSNVMEHVNRGTMLKALTPGCPVAYDLHNYVERFAEYFELAVQNDASIQIGNILGMRQDRLSPWVPADSHFYDVLRTGLSQLAKDDRSQVVEKEPVPAVQLGRP